MPDSIIVYRNPLEKMIWEGITGNGHMGFAIIAFAVVMLITFLTVLQGLEWAMNTHNMRCQRNRFNIPIASVISFLAACLTVWAML